MQSILFKSFLKDTYVKRGMSTWTIEKKFGISRSTVYAALKRHGITTRSIAQSHIRYSRSDFSGDLCEKAYLIGFAIGDLRVRKLNGTKSTTISIGCGSTKSAQITLITDLFSTYGRVWKGKPDRRGAVNIEAFVNDSFSFLLPTVRNYLWCTRVKRHFFAFLSGFTDAEGSFFLSKNMARVAWGNYDSEVLTFIKTGLEKFGISTSKICTDSLKGLVGSHGYARNGNYSHLSCARKEMVAKLLKELEPFLRHGDKRSRMAHLRKNLIMRGICI